MAAPQGVAHSTTRRTTWPPTGRAQSPLPPNHRKFPFESAAAARVAGAAVTAQRPLNQGDEGSGQELQAPGFGSPGARDGLDVGGARDGPGMENFLSPDFFPGPGQARSRSPGPSAYSGPLTHQRVTFTLHLPGPSRAASLR